MLHSQFGYEPIGTVVTLNFIIITTIFTLTVLLTITGEEDSVIINVTLNLFCWKSFTTMFFMIFGLINLRLVEKIMGTTSILIFMAHSFIVYIPFFATQYYFYPKNSTISFIHIYPHSLLEFVIWRFPMQKSNELIPLKAFSFVLLAFDLLYEFPFAFIPFVSGIISNILWSYDIFMLYKYSIRNTNLNNRRDETIEDNDSDVENIEVI